MPPHPVRGLAQPACATFLVTRRAEHPLSRQTVSADGLVLEQENKAVAVVNEWRH